jgi:hypothetical protein
MNSGRQVTRLATYVGLEEFFQRQMQKITRAESGLALTILEPLSDFLGRYFARKRPAFQCQACTLRFHSFRTMQMETGRCFLECFKGRIT